jgi:SAM-dependent methyltransferase
MSRDNLRHSYNPAFFAPLFATEDRHFWFRARNHVLATLVGQVVATLPPGYRVLEVGCGTGNVLRVLEGACPGGSVVGMDLFHEGLAFARRRTSRVSLVQGDMHHPPFWLPFHLVGLFDMLEHMPDDEAVLRQIHALLGVGDTLLLTVPAHPALWSYFDEAACHYRRYTPAMLRSKLTAAGYHVEYLTLYMAAIAPLVWVGRKLATLTRPRPAPNTKKQNQMDEQTLYHLAARELRVVPGINEVLVWMLEQEVRLIKHRRTIPAGTSLLALARKAE